MAFKQKRGRPRKKPIQGESEYEKLIFYMKQISNIKESKMSTYAKIVLEKVEGINMNLSLLALATIFYTDMDADTTLEDALEENEQIDELLNDLISRNVTGVKGLDAVQKSRLRSRFKSYCYTVGNAFDEYGAKTEKVTTEKKKKEEKEKEEEPESEESEEETSEEEEEVVKVKRK